MDISPILIAIIPGTITLGATWYIQRRMARLQTDLSAAAATQLENMRSRHAQPARAGS